jgi:hypothetical protein
MRRLTALTLFIITLSSLAAAPQGVIRPPMAVVSQNVLVSVGPKMSMVVGRYWYQYIPSFDDGAQRIAIHYLAFVPKDASSHAELLEISQVKLMVGERQFLPETARVLEPAEVGAIELPPEDAAVALFTFQVPRSLATLRFDVVISHFQPHYRYEGQNIAAFLPWLPHLEELRRPQELKDSDFIVSFEALAGAKFEHATTNLEVRQKSDNKLVVHPRHFTNIAVRVDNDPQPPAAKN